MQPANPVAAKRIANQASLLWEPILCYKSDFIGIHAEFILGEEIAIMPGVTNSTSATSAK